MKAKTRERDGVIIIDLRRNLTGGEDADRFDLLIKEILAAGHRRILVNMSKVTFVNSCGLGILIRGYTSVINAGGQFKLMKITDRIRSLLVITQLIRIFEVFEDEDEAVASFEPVSVEASASQKQEAGAGQEQEASASQEQ